ncbi:MAG: transglycosylase domain-containing protein [bacterium]|nr:transglycosylase domain-containing protein [bacterium]
MLKKIKQILRKIKRRHIIRGVLTGVGLIIFAGLVMFFLLIKDLPSPELLSSRQIPESTKIYDKTGKILLYEVFDEERRTIIPFAEIPQSVKNATIAIEDKDFYTHPAFDFKSFLRAAIANLVSGWGSQGGSTITQQLAKNAFLSREKTITRKIKELILAFRLEKKFTKDEILYLYLNQIPYGSNAYGIEAASQIYFQKSARDLTLAESALLVSLPQAPTYYSPWGKNVPELLNRKNLVLRQMEELGYIAAKERAAAQQEELTFERPDSSIKAPHFSIAVKDYLIATYGEDFVRRAGLTVITTLDWELQQAADKAVADGAKRNEELYKGTNAALVAQDVKTGQILAMVGSRGYFETEYEGNFNVATQGLRQPGSAMKPFAYLTAFEKGYPSETVLFDLKTEFDTTDVPENSYQPENFDHLFRGPISMRNALAQSINVAAVKTAYLAGIDTLLKKMKLLGVTTLTERSRYGLSLVLGGGEVKLIELLRAYSTLASEGTLHNQALILSVRDKTGKTLESYEDQTASVIEPQYARMINDILSDQQARAPLFSSSFNLTVFQGYDVAMKTGTTNDYRDAWTFGYTPTIAVGVWAGNNNNQPMERQGGSILAAVPIWNAFLTQALKNQPPETFTSPDPVTSNKPMLNGQYLPLLPDDRPDPKGQIHDILYYINKNNPLGPAPINPRSDPQFENWENPVLAWAATTGNGSTGSEVDLPEGDQPPKDGILDIIAPVAGARARSKMDVYAILNLETQNITKIQLYFNDELVDQKINNYGSSFEYRTTIRPKFIQKQNFLKLVVTNDVGGVTTREVFLSD